MKLSILTETWIIWAGPSRNDIEWQARIIIFIFSGFSFAVFKKNYIWNSFDSI